MRRVLLSLVVALLFASAALAHPLTATGNRDRLILVHVTPAALSHQGAKGGCIGAITLPHRIRRVCSQIMLTFAFSQTERADALQIPQHLGFYFCGIGRVEIELLEPLREQSRIIRPLSG